MNDMNARILIADDHEVVREGPRFLLANARPEWRVCGEANTGEQTIERVRDLKPDIVLLHITMPGVSGLETSSRLHELGLDCRVLIFTTHQFETLGTEVCKAGAQGFVLKSQAFDDLVLAIETVLAGRTFFGRPEPQQVQDRKGPSLGIVFFRSDLRRVGSF
jgi:DNA-binding NarL/FixJ family response regulator